MMRGSSSDVALDPFLTSLNDHSRQESADSGLGKFVSTHYTVKGSRQGDYDSARFHYTFSIFV